jgi:PEGA domain
MWAVTKRAALLTAAVLMAGAGTASAEPIHGRANVVVGVGGGPFYSPFYYDPFWGPFYPYAYGAYPFVVHPEGTVKVEVSPKQAQVYVDGYYAGVVDDFDGVFKRLHTSPGGHAITLHLEGYRTVTQNIYASPDNTYKLKETMEKLGPGERSEAPPAPSRPAARPGTGVKPGAPAPGGH